MTTPHTGRGPIDPSLPERLDCWLDCWIHYRAEETVVLSNASIIIYKLHHGSSRRHWQTHSQFLKTWYSEPML